MIAFAGLPFAALFIAPEPGRVVIISILSAMILFAHRKNLFAEFSPRPAADKTEPSKD